jgi:hypothetical protein
VTLRRASSIGCVFALLSAAAWAAPQASAPAPTPQPPQTANPQEPAPDKTQKPDQVPNMPAYQQKTVVNQPPAETPLPAAPPLPPPAPAAAQNQIKTMPPYQPVADDTTYVPSALGSTYVPLDNWVNDAVLRLYSLGYVDTAFLGIRPWTRLSIEHMLARCAKKLDANEPPDSQAREIYEALRAELEQPGVAIPGGSSGHYQLASVYSRFMGITGPSLNILDSYSVGQTLVNDYGRPYANGFNNVSGFSTRASDGRFSFYFRGEFQHAPGWMGYDDAQTAVLAGINENNYKTLGPLGVPTLTEPNGAIASQNNARILETDLAVHLAGHEISVGKHDEWLGPNQGGSFAYSNNAEPIYAFKINRVEPLYIPLVDKLLGPVRYEFFVGSLKGHSVPNDPWVHVEKFSFKPTVNFEFGFERTVIWGGKNHEGVSFGTFWHSFYSISDTNPIEKCSEISSGNPPPGYPPPHVANCKDPGARFSEFDYSYRLPYLRNWLTWTLDSFVHDDVTPISAPRRSAVRTGLYLSHVPAAPRLDLRVEAGFTDPDTGASVSGQFMYFEQIQHEGVTNKGVLFSDILGREGKGGQAWLTYHLSPSEMLQANVRTTKVAKDFIPGGTTQVDSTVKAIKRLHTNLELNGWVQYERYNIPFLKPGVQNDTTMALQLTWFPANKTPE